jgi:hypothetical protein
MANPTYRREAVTVRRPSKPSLPFGGGLIINADGSLLKIDVLSFLLVD